MRKRLLTIGLILVIALAFGLIETIRESMFEPRDSLFESENSDDYLLDDHIGDHVGERSPLYEVERVVDGDTIIIEMNGKRERVRFIGLDAPESVHADESKNTEEGRQASIFTTVMLEGKKVSLEFDVQERDKFGRILAYVYLGDEMFNEILIREGHAQAISYPPNVKHQERFRQIQKKRDADK